MKVSDIMVTRVATIAPDEGLATVKSVFDHARFHHLPVVEEGKLVGILSDRDVERSISPFLGTVNEQSRDVQLLQRKVHQIMTRAPVTASPDMTIPDAVRMMRERRFSCLPVTDAEGKLLGLVTWKDVVRAFVPEAFETVPAMPAVAAPPPETAEPAPPPPPEASAP